MTQPTITNIRLKITHLKVLKHLTGADDLTFPMYCTLQGGYKAVIWTDVFQAVIMYAGVLFVLLKVYFNLSPPGHKMAAISQTNFADDIFRCIFGNEMVYILIKISPKFVSKGPIDHNPTLV